MRTQPPAGLDGDLVAYVLKGGSLVDLCITGDGEQDEGALGDCAACTLCKIVLALLSSTETSLRSFGRVEGNRDRQSFPVDLGPLRVQARGPPAQFAA